MEKSGPEGSLAELLAQCSELSSEVKKVRSSQLSSVSLREDIKSFVKNYFRQSRPPLEIHGVQVTELDSVMQTLLATTNGRGTVKTYKKLFKTISNELVRIEGELEVSLSRRGVQSVSVSAIFGTDALIIEIMERTSPAAAICYRQGLLDLRETRLSYRGTCAEFREVLREVLDYLAPDKDVKAVPGFKLEEGLNGPSMKQKVRYILKNRDKSATSIETPENAANIVDEGVAKLVRATYNRGSIGAHTDQAGLAEVRQIKRYLDTVLCELLEIR